MNLLKSLEIGYDSTNNIKIQLSSFNILIILNKGCKECMFLNIMK